MVFTRFLTVVVLVSTTLVSFTQGLAIDFSPRADHVGRAAAIKAVAVKRSEESTALEARSTTKFRALAWGDSGANLKKAIKKNEVKLMYTWGPQCPPEAKELNIECICMLWGYKDIGEFEKERSSHYYLAGPNEFNIKGQSYMSTSSAIKLWNEYIRPFKKDHYLISPVVASTNDALEIMQYFLDHCGGPKSENCGFDGVALHYYGTKASDLIAYVTKMYNGLRHIPIWLTEFSCINFSGHGSENCSEGEVWAFIQEVVEWAEKTEWVHMYSAYGWSTSLAKQHAKYALLNEKGGLSDLGEWYVKH